MDALENIRKLLHKCNAGDFKPAAINLLSALGYNSKRDFFVPESPEKFLQMNPKVDTSTKGAEKFKEAVKSVHSLFQFTEDEIPVVQKELLSDSLKEGFSEDNDDSFLFFAVELKGKEYTRSEYVTFTREINKQLNIPSIVLFRCGNAGKRRVTLSFVGRRPSQTNPDFDVLGRVSLLREIICDLENQHRGHLDILEQLTLEERLDWMGEENKKGFEGLLSAWLDGLDTEALNTRFYEELREWFDRAVDAVKFPRADTEAEKTSHVIRLLSRILFIWFIKEKKLVEKKLFIEEQVMLLLTKTACEQGDNYYRAILQNLFFATLNTKIVERKFRKPDEKPNANYPQYENYGSHRVFQYRRYENMLCRPAELAEWLNESPFVNGGLFECLDPQKSTKHNRVDCFTDDEETQKQLSVPDSLFFNEAEKSKGLFVILKGYKFTVEENTPIEQEVALDPELLGKVFENLLVYTERKQTGSYYTPRVVVDYMVRESLFAYFCRTMPKANENTLRNLLTEEVDYEQAKEQLNKNEIIQFIKAVGELRLIDPAAGSGAFPMGALQKMTMALKRVDPENEFLKKRELEVAENHEDSTIHEDSIALVENVFSKDNQYNNYGRKLSLIRKSIFGVDIQTIAVQICRLRFFISLAIEQIVNKTEDNYGISPLPNLETKIVAANTLIKVIFGDIFRSIPEIKKLEKEIKDIREKFFSVTDREVKNKLREQDKQKRKKLEKLLEEKEKEAQSREQKFLSGDAKKIAHWDLYAHDTAADWFSPSWMFNVEDGFHIVIGNPPYVKAEHHSQETKRYLQKNYDWTGDLYDHFIFKAYDLASNEGVFSYICNDSYLQFSSKKRIRELFLRNSLRLLTKCPIKTFDATIYTAIFLAEKSNPAANHFYISGMFSKGDYEYQELGPVSYGAVKKNNNKLFYKSPMSSLYERLSNDCKSLEKFLAVLDTGIDSGNVREKIFFLTEEKIRLSRLFQGKQINRYLLDWNAPSAKFKYCDINYEPQPVLGVGRKGALSKRNEYWGFRGDINNHRQPERLLLRQTADRFVVAYHSEEEQGRFYTDNTLFTLLPRGDSINLKVAMAILNSKLMEALYQFSAQEQGKVLAQVKTGTVKNMPFIMPDKKEGDKIAELAGQIIKEKEANPKANISAQEDEINNLVYKLYNLTKDEIAIIEGENPKANTSA